MLTRKLSAGSLYGCILILVAPPIRRLHTSRSLKDGARAKLLVQGTVVETSQPNSSRAKLSCDSPSS